MDSDAMKSSFVGLTFRVIGAALHRRCCNTQKHYRQGSQLLLGIQYCIK